MSSSRGWFESEEDYRARVSLEADEETIERLSGSSPSRGWFESSDEYRERISEEAKEQVIESYTGDAPSKGIFESSDDYASRIEQEANEAIVSRSSGTTPSRGWFESSDDYNVRVRREANESIVHHHTGTEPSRGWFEGQHEYRSRIAHEAREAISNWKPAKSNSHSSSYDDGYESDTGSVQELRTWEEKSVSRLVKPEDRIQTIVDAVVLMSDRQLDEAMTSATKRSMRTRAEKTTFDEAVVHCIVSRKEKNLFELIKTSKLGHPVLSALYRHRVNEYRGKSKEQDFVIDHLMGKNWAFLHFLGEGCMEDAKQQYAREQKAAEDERNRQEEERRRRREMLAAEPGLVRFLRWLFSPSQ